MIRKAQRLENKARRLWNARTLSPDSWQNIVANSYWNRAQELRKGAWLTRPVMIGWFRHEKLPIRNHRQKWHYLRRCRLQGGRALCRHSVSRELCFRHLAEKGCQMKQILLEFYLEQLGLLTKKTEIPKGKNQMKKCLQTPGEGNARQFARIPLTKPEKGK